MTRKILPITLIVFLALNLAGVGAFAAAFDCGMSCCNTGQTDLAGAPAFGTPSCCQLDGVTCGYGAGPQESLLVKAICCHSGVQKIAGKWDHTVSSNTFSPSPTLRFPSSEVNRPPPQTAPVYLSNATFLC